jgi:GxxExxY protein
MNSDHSIGSEGSLRPPDDEATESGDDSSRHHVSTNVNAETAGNGTERARIQKLLHEDVTKSIIAAFFAVYNKLGYGFLEKIYCAALAIELRRRGHRVGREVVVPVYYDGERIGSYRVDLLTDDVVVVEVKSTERLNPSDPRQLLNSLCATSLDVGLLLHFGPKPKFHRVIAPRRFRRS